ncbi:MAG: hypothetical protein Q4C83_00400 [Candidatus Saccharibacteria bacterium]|nr:hypothetical protein [Candidatus Saccharibacteria bacterium]
MAKNKKRLVMHPECTLYELKATLFELTEACRWGLIIGMAMEVIGGCLVMAFNTSKLALVVATILAFCGTLMYHSLSSMSFEYPTSCFIGKDDVDEAEEKDEEEAIVLLFKAWLRLTSLNGLSLAFSVGGAYCWIGACVIGVTPWSIRYDIGLLVAFLYALAIVHNIVSLWYLAEAGYDCEKST